MDKESTKGSGKGKKNKTPTTSAEEPKFALKFLAPEALSGAIVGREGSTIAAMRTKFNAAIQLSDRKETYPGTDCRMLTIQCDSEDEVLTLAKHIVEMQTEVIKPEELEKNKNPSAVAEALSTQEGDLKVTLLVPRSAGGGIIGKGGVAIKALRESSGAKKVNVGESSGTEPSANQMISIVGSVKAIQAVVEEANKQVQALKDEAWFSSWVSAGPADASYAGRGYSDAGWNDWSGGWGSGGWGGTRGIDTLVQVAHETPLHVLEDSRGFAMSCTIPKGLAGGLIGRKGVNIQNVKRRTNTDITIREIPDDPDHQSLNIVGPLPNACAAYMLMMKLYLDAEEAQS